MSVKLRNFIRTEDQFPPRNLLNSLRTAEHTRIGPSELIGPREYIDFNRISPTTL